MNFVYLYFNCNRLCMYDLYLSYIGWVVVVEGWFILKNTKM